MAKKAWHEQKDFLKLRKQWYAKLTKDGFHDAEHTDWTDGSALNLLNGNGNYSSGHDAARVYTPDKESYYTMMRQVAWDYKRRWGAQRFEVVRLIGDGLSGKEIQSRTGATRYEYRKWRKVAQDIVFARAKGLEDPK